MPDHHASNPSSDSSQSDGDDHSPDSDASQDDADVQVESLIAGRAKRATAGNRLSSLLDKEADDDLELLFAEDEEDIEFEGADDEDASDVQLDTSDEDEDDRGPAAPNEEEDLEGEKELQKQARADRQAKKRKADAFFKAPANRKKVKIDPTAPIVARVSPVKPKKKKSERVTWMPETVDGPVRASSRRATVQNKEVIIGRMKEQEKRRTLQVAAMTAAAKRKEKDTPKVMTQADRLAEAERTEKANSKSLNRWEETETKRLAEQKRKLAALHNRKMEGPIITWFSGVAEWVNGKLFHVGRKSRVIKPKRKDKQKGKRNGESDDTDTSDDENNSSEEDSDVSATPMPEARHKSAQVHERAREEQWKQPQQPLPQETPPNITSIPAAPIEAPMGAMNLNNPASTAAQPAEDVSPAEKTDPEHSTMPQLVDQQPQQEFSVVIVKDPVATELVVPKEPDPDPLIEYSNRVLIILENFDPVAIRDREVQRRILFKRKTAKVMKKHVPEICVITGKPARFRDPSTNLPYANGQAYKAIQKLKTGVLPWSTLLGCYVGSPTEAASGVPEGFLHGGKKAKEGVSAAKEGKQG